MLRKLRLPLIIGALSLFALQWLPADDNMDVEYAQILPLAPESMLLDVTRTSRGFVAVGERGHVILSTDGKSWVQADNVPTRATLTNVFSLGGRLYQR